MTVTGSTQTEAAILESAALLGYESSETEPRGDVGFVDWPFRSSGDPWDVHLEAVRRHQPAIATAPDLEPGMDPATVYDRADELLEAGAGTVLLVTKHPDVHPTEIPDRFRPAIPFAGDEFSGGTPWRLGDYRGLEGVHILGGVPPAHLEAARYVPVDSVDTSAPQSAATWGKWYDPDQPTQWTYGGEGVDLYDAIRASLDGMVAAWADFYHQTRPDALEEVRPPDVDPTDALGYGRPEEHDPESGLWAPGDTGPAGEPVGEDPDAVAERQVASIKRQAADAGLEPARSD